MQRLRCWFSNILLPFWGSPIISGSTACAEEQAVSMMVTKDKEININFFTLNFSLLQIRKAGFSAL
jgi:hypothetical protein